MDLLIKMVISWPQFDKTFLQWGSYRAFGQKSMRTWLCKGQLSWAFQLLQTVAIGQTSHPKLFFWVMMAQIQTQTQTGLLRQLNQQNFVFPAKKKTMPANDLAHFEHCSLKEQQAVYLH
jgi:hypothetical protein